MSIITTLLKPSAPSILVRLSDESGDEDCRQYADDSMNQETSQSLIPHSLEYGLGSANINPRIEDLVVIHLRRTRGRKGRLVTTSDSPVNGRIDNDASGHSPIYIPAADS